MNVSEKNKDFFDLVYQVCREIPKGKVTSYGAIAKYLGASKGARMVGWAMNNVHQKADVPAHRVVNRNGQLTGKMHFETPNTMQQKLEQEGVIIKENTIQNFQTIFWNPAEELTL